MAEMVPPQIVLLLGLDNGASEPMAALNEEVLDCQQLESANCWSRPLAAAVATAALGWGERLPPRHRLPLLLPQRRHRQPPPAPRQDPQPEGAPAATTTPSASAGWPAVGHCNSQRPSSRESEVPPAAVVRCRALTLSAVVAATALLRAQPEVRTRRWAATPSPDSGVGDRCCRCFRQTWSRPEAAAGSFIPGRETFQLDVAT